MSQRNADVPAIPGFSPLTGLKAAWLRVFMDAASAMQTAAWSRGRSFGILCDDDRYAIAYRIANRRKERAYLSLTGWPFGCPISAERFDKDGYRDTTRDELAELWERWWHKGRELKPLREKLDAISEHDEMVHNGY